jgi:hypothetical protein
VLESDGALSCVNGSCADHGFDHRYVDQIVKQHPTFDSGIPYIFKGAFLLAAVSPMNIKGFYDRLLLQVDWATSHTLPACSESVAIHVLS